MKTTNLIAELLVIGVFGTFWILPTISICYNVNYSNLTENINLVDLSLGFAILYFIGMVMNYISDVLYKKIDYCYARKHGGKEALWQMRYNILIKSSDAGEYLFQRRSIIRIFRANSLNIFLISIVIIISPVFDGIVPLKNRILLSAVVLLIAIISFLAYRRSLIGYFKFLNNSNNA